MSFNVQIMGLDPEGNIKPLRIDESGYIRVGSTAVMARQTNPTALADGAIASFSADDLGRLLTRPYQVRDLISTGYATLTRATETTVLSAVAGAALDLVSLVASNSSTVAQVVDIRSVTAGSIEFTLAIPAGNTVIKDFLVPRQQADTGNNWTAQVSTGGEISDSPVTVSMIASREI